MPFDLHSPKAFIIVVFKRKTRKKKKKKKKKKRKANPPRAFFIMHSYFDNPPLWLTELKAPTN